MADVDFGDSELFEEFDHSAPTVPTHIRFSDDEEEPEETGRLRARLEDYEDSIQRLTEENAALRRRLNVLSQPSGITIEDANTDGPLLQVLYANNSISNYCRQEIEDCIFSVIQKHQTTGHEKKLPPTIVKPQSSAVAMDDDPPRSTSGVKTTPAAFKVVGSVLYFPSFSVDKLGQPLVNENPQMTEGWDIPTYHQVYNQVLGAEGQEIEMKDKRPKSLCFNCGCGGHQLRDCPKPKDMAAISERRKEFNQNSNQIMLGNQRYHADEVEERFAKYKPGVMSEELLAALGIDGNTLPPLIYRMRQLGYPPGWLKEAEMENSGLTLYDGNASNNGNTTEQSKQDNIFYDVSKLHDFPGFNVPVPDKMKDEFMQYGSIPLQSHQMKHNYAAYLSNNFPIPGATCNKRRRDSDSSPQQRKKNRSSPDHNSSRSSDMDIESDPGTPYNSRRSDFHFQPPLPPGSPCFNSPPPLPQGTPPATPTPPPLPKGTPPPTPNNGSPAVRGQNWVVVDDAVDGADDELTLEELEEQQRLIWAALENTDTATNSDCDTPTIGTPIPSSPSVSTPVRVDTETEEVEEAMDTERPLETGTSRQNLREPENQELYSQSPGPIKAEEDSPESPHPVRSQDDSPQSPGPIKSLDDSPQSPGPIKSLDDNPQSPGPIKSLDDSPQSPGPIKSLDDSPQSPGPIKSLDDNPQSPEPLKVQDDNLPSPGPVKSHGNDPPSPDPDSSNRDVDDNASLKHDEKITAVPHRSKFAAGIVPFEDTPEFTEVAEATGTYLKIRELLKGSPRSLTKKKNNLLS